MKAALRRLDVEPLSKAAFQRFGDVIETTRVRGRPINEGFALRFHDLARIDVAREGGRPVLSLFRATRRPTPLVIRTLERHPLGSQAFFPLSRADWLIVTAEGDDAPDASTLRCFRASGSQGVNYAANTWHFPVLIIVPEQSFIVIDREGPGNNLDERRLAASSEALIEIA